ncbi:zinc dependent phospholipase C family protein [Flaviaesturariibacter amylovorans]|uniref:Phospholipase C/D domain-containing protein n=1 Tax=Flaviaesturariibacter amylovorans TaxID=1084520 RepID=A0ABP8GQ97_9BACT
MTSSPRLPLIALFLALLLAPARAEAYSVLTHQAIIDAVWESSMRPLLRARFPDAGADAWKEARAAAYGGALTPDIGYYPGGSKLFTNLVHYTRSGDFVQALLREAHSIQEYAFALGVLSHYHADRWGHGIGTNQSVPIVYPKHHHDRRSVTYEEDPIAHQRVEFGFDVLQTARGNYASEAYHDFIGFRVEDSLLGRAFRSTYGLELKDVYPQFARSVNTLRFCVRSLFPLITRAAWQNRKPEIRAARPGVTARSFAYRMRRKEYQKAFGGKKDRPGFGVRMLAGLIWLLPKVGPLKPLKFRVPGREAEKLFVKSFDTVTHFLGRDMAAIVHSGRPSIPNYDFDTGEPTKKGGYALADDTYRRLLLRLYDDGFKGLDGPLRQNILDFYGKEAPASQLTDRDAARLEAAFRALRNAAVTHR